MNADAEDLPEGWELVRLRDVVSLSKKKTEPSDRPDAAYLSLEHIEANTGRNIDRGFGADVAILAKAFRGELVPTEAELARREAATTNRRRRCWSASGRVKASQLHESTIAPEYQWGEGDSSPSRLTHNLKRTGVVTSANPIM